MRRLRLAARATSLDSRKYCRLMQMSGRPGGAATDLRRGKNQPAPARPVRWGGKDECLFCFYSRNVEGANEREDIGAVKRASDSKNFKGLRQPVSKRSCSWRIPPGGTAMKCQKCMLRLRKPHDAAYVFILDYPKSHQKVSNRCPCTTAHWIPAIRKESLVHCRHFRKKEWKDAKFESVPEARLRGWEGGVDGEECSSEATVKVQSPNSQSICRYLLGIRN
ncbi:hypothetical protein EVAR_16768_1 [Eumeta japonica]|uniref:Uncharacterized protein n=1 Tax=Eumeta variegata TaxID=151549 RepID=A0A4C1UKW6_EUMVA|nr:hypothetical protein EVAR_16768_1 [Eumeta japonica]